MHACSEGRASHCERSQLVESCRAIALLRLLCCLDGLYSVARDLRWAVFGLDLLLQAVFIPMAASMGQAELLQHVAPRIR